AEIPAYCVNTGCKIGYIRRSMRPHLQPVFPCLAVFLSVGPGIVFVNISKSRKRIVFGDFSFYNLSDVGAFFEFTECSTKYRKNAPKRGAKKCII
ncbi:MAG: hypothetical protein Q4D43_07445, partial [Clostridia bacterium]|nr:hypothetical protein [Clostridia bacterium]